MSTIPISGSPARSRLTFSSNSSTLRLIVTGELQLTWGLNPRLRMRVEPVPVGKRLGIGHIERRHGDLLAVERREQGILVDERPREMLTRCTPCFMQAKARASIR